MLVMDDGRVVERGTHDALMASRGGYFELVRRQMHATSEGAGDPVLE